MPENNPPSGTREAVACAVREAMARKKISGRALADQLGVTQSAFSRRTTGEVAFTVDELAAVATALDEPVTKLLAGLPPVGAA